MDEQVLRGLAKWPNVPAVFEWLSLDRRGQWLLAGEPITNVIVCGYIARNYAADETGRWFFQNGPQRVYLDLEYLPFIYRAVPAPGGELRLETHTGTTCEQLEGAWLDEVGALILATEQGPGLLHDRDLETVATTWEGADGQPLTDDALAAAVDQLTTGKPASVFMRIGDRRVEVLPIQSAAVPQRLGFVQHPEPEGTP